jgi:hypothetical protein
MEDKVTELITIKNSIMTGYYYLSLKYKNSIFLKLYITINRILSLQ